MGKIAEFLVILVIIAVLFGAKKLPELAKGISRSAKEVRKGFSEEASRKSEVSESEEKTA